MRYLSLALLALSACDSGSTALQLVATNPTSNLVDPTPLPTPTAKTCPDGTISSYTYADNSTQFCIDSAIDAPGTLHRSGKLRADGMKYDDAESSCGSEKHICSLPEAMGARRDGHLASGHKIWINGVSVSGRQRSATVYDTTTESYGFDYITDGQTSTVYRHHFYCCSEAQ